MLHHPMFWDSELRLSFLRDTSDRVELEDRSDSALLKALEGIAPTALGGGKWNEKMEHAFIIDIGRHRRYKFDDIRDLLRVIRNKLNHYRELPNEIQVYFPDKLYITLQMLSSVYVHLISFSTLSSLYWGRGRVLGEEKLNG